jgi:hypothetical protein
MHPAANRSSPTLTSPWLGFALAAAVYALVAAWQIDLPGVYMDEVNPDYLVVKLLNPGHAPIPGWVLPGNYLLGERVPWLVQLYHGSQTFWLGLPLFALFGTTVEGLRLTHAAFGAGVLAALYWLLLCARLAPWQAALACGALALDPSFSYAFRTQSYITLAADAWLLLAAACLLRAARGEHRRARFSGAACGRAPPSSVTSCTRSTYPRLPQARGGRHAATSRARRCAGAPPGSPGARPARARTWPATHCSRAKRVAWGRRGRSSTASRRRCTRSIRRLASSSGWRTRGAWWSASSPMRGITR